MGDQRSYESGRNDYGEYLYKTVSPKVTIFKKGTIHVQTYTITRRFSEKDHKWHDHFIRSKARKMTQAEIEKYGPIIKHFNPNVKF